MPVGVGAKPAGGAAKSAAPAKPAAPPSAPPAGSEGKKGGPIKLIIVIVVVVVLLVSLAVGTLFLLKALGILGGGGGGGEGQAEPTPIKTELKLGTVTVSTGEPLNVNLADGFLSFQATLYFDESVTAEGHSGDLDASPARAVALNLFKGMKKEELNKPGAIQELEKKYLDSINKEMIPPYDGHVVQVRFTTFAYQ